MGASNAVLGPDQLDTPLTYEAMQAAGSGLGSGSYLVFDERDDLTAVAAGVARFLAVESCGQCTPCKQDGLEIADRLASLCAGTATEADLHAVEARLASVTTGARCNLATQQQVVVGSILARFAADVRAHLDPATAPVEPRLVGDLVEIDGSAQAVVDDRFRQKQPDWTYDARWSGKSPVDRFADHRDHRPPE